MKLKSYNVATNLYIVLDGNKHMFSLYCLDACIYFLSGFEIDFSYFILDGRLPSSLSLLIILWMSNRSAVCRFMLTG